MFKGLFFIIFAHCFLSGSADYVERQLPVFRKFPDDLIIRNTIIDVAGDITIADVELQEKMHIFPEHFFKAFLHHNRDCGAPHRMQAHELLLRINQSKKMLSGVTNGEPVLQKCADNANIRGSGLAKISNQEPNVPLPASRFCALGNHLLNTNIGSDLGITNSIGGVHCSVGGAGSFFCFSKNPTRLPDSHCDERHANTSYNEHEQSPFRHVLLGFQIIGFGGLIIAGLVRLRFALRRTGYAKSDTIEEAIMLVLGGGACALFAVIAAIG